MTSLLTCKEFLQELTDYMDSTVDAELRRKLEAHISECPNCFVILDTTQKTIRVYKGMEPQADSRRRSGPVDESGGAQNRRKKDGCSLGLRIAQPPP